MVMAVEEAGVRTGRSSGEALTAVNATFSEVHHGPSTVVVG